MLNIVKALGEAEYATKLGIIVWRVGILLLLLSSSTSPERHASGSARVSPSAARYARTWSMVGRVRVGVGVAGGGVARLAVVRGEVVLWVSLVMLFFLKLQSVWYQ